MELGLGRRGGGGGSSEKRLNGFNGSNGLGP